MSEISKDQVFEALKSVVDSATNTDIVSAGMVQGLIVRGKNVGFAIDIGKRDPAENADLRDRAEAAVRGIEGVQSASVVLTSEREAPPPPSMGREMPGGPDAPPPPPGLELPGIKHIVAVASGKGGVGKSTVAVNLALALKSLGMKVGMLDADIYGPSLPRMLGEAKTRPEAANEDQIEPVEAWGMKTMSIGYLMDENTAMIWRGPMVAGALSQLFSDVAWGELDVLVVDMPPGTGDAQLTLAQRVPVDGAVIVSTPQDIALIDARKGIQMFEKVGVPIFGIVENMSVFICPKCGEGTHIFGAGGAKATAEELGADFLGEIPLHASIREKMDAGQPVVASEPDSAEAAAFIAVAEKVKEKLAQKIDA